MSLAQLTIYGAGLMGGSLALAARNASLAERISAIDLAATADDGGLGIFDEWVQADDAAAVAECLGRSEMTVLCVPVRSIIELLPEVMRLSPGIITDFGSTKQAITESLKNHPERSRFVAGHPMAGHPRGGLRNAQPELFRDRKWIICPEASSESAVAAVKQLALAVGARVVELSAKTHDEAVAITSHVPQVVASALSVRANTQNALSAAGPGFASATRVAGGAEGMWRDIFETNGVAVGEELKRVGESLQRLGEELMREDVQSTLALLKAAREVRSDEES